MKTQRLPALPQQHGIQSYIFQVKLQSVAGAAQSFSLVISAYALPEVSLHVQVSLYNSPHRLTPYSCLATECRRLKIRCGAVSFTFR